MELKKTIKVKANYLNEKDKLVEIKDLGNRNIIGLNKNNEIILFISGVEVKDIIEDKNKFINRINKLIL